MLVFKTSRFIASAEDDHVKAKLHSFFHTINLHISTVQTVKFDESS